MRYEDRVPNLLVAGVTKTGTTSLYWYLTQHPDVCRPKGCKEIDFFTPMRRGEPPLGDVEAYGAFFAACAGERYRLDASPQYFDGGRALVEAVRRYTPNARVLVLLRDPVERLWSHYRDIKSKDKLADNMPFRKFFECGVAVHGTNGSRQQHTNFRATSLGCYAEYLRDWFDVFDDRVGVLFHEHLVRDAQAFTAEICVWLGIDPAVTRGFDYEVRNRTVDPRSVAFSRFAYAVNRRVGPTLRKVPTAKRVAREVYAVLNRRGDGEQLGQDDRRAMEHFYAPGIAALRDELRRRGYDDLPAWLGGAA